MGARAEATAATAERILDAAEALFEEAPSRDATLEQVAERAGVSVQTVIRRFGGREGVFAAALERATARVTAARDAAPPDDLTRALELLVDHYEEHGDMVMRMLADETRSERVAGIVADGRRWHAEWCERVFAGTLARLRGGDRERRLAQVIAVCDVYTWKLLRRDRRLGRAQTELALREMLSPLVAS